jgi:DNA invertase Pin-like site-specific DNA recombinase
MLRKWYDTDSDEQATSYEAQVDYYTRYIQGNDDFEFIGVYADEGISATSTKKREQFNKMINDALEGKIDLILTKSVSRFARNTVDTLTTVRKLKEKGIEVIFEKENIATLDSKGELLITIMSSLAQEESRSISENTTWGQRKRFADGKVSMPYGRFLGYEKGKDGNPQIVPEEAKIVTLIYKMFLEGKTPSGIAKHLTNQGIPSPGGKSAWQGSTIKSILQNEKYCGNALLQKSFTVDFLTKKQKINEGEVPKYFVENSHPGIVSVEIYNLVQGEFQKRKKMSARYSDNSIFSSRIICGDCDGYYSSKVWHSTSKYRRTVWQCCYKFKKEKPCSTPHLSEESIKQAFIGAFNSLLSNKDEILKSCFEAINILTDISQLEKKKAEFQAELEVITELTRKLIEENAQKALNQAEYMERYSALMKRFEAAKSGLVELDAQKLQKTAKRERIVEYLNGLEKQDGLITEFDEALWLTTVENLTVHSNKKTTFTFKDGSIVQWKI